MAARKKAKKKVAAKTASRKKTAAKAKPKKAAPNPAPVKTGRGPSAMEVAKGVVEMLKAGKPDAEIWKTWFSPKLVSVEGMGMEMAWSGLKAVQGKSEWWLSQNTVNAVEVEGPFVGATGFAIRYKMTTTAKATGETRTNEEVGVYTVQNGKVIREEFMYSMC